MSAKRESCRKGGNREGEGKAKVKEEEGRWPRKEKVRESSTA